MNLRLAVSATVVVFALAGCGGSDSSGDEEAAVLEAVKQSNVTFARGDYAATCTYYTERLRREMAAQTGAKDCVDQWRQTAASMRETMTREQIDAMTSYHAETAEVDGDRATATYGEPPASIKDLPGVALTGKKVELRREGGRWRIDALPQVALESEEVLAS